MQNRPPSRTLAKAILEAWAVGDPIRVRVALDEAVAACATTRNYSPFEEESMEALAGAASAIRRSPAALRPKSTPEQVEIEVSLRLLRHVASTHAFQL
jgi:hypothetical protein